jgi:hypothetical protein
MAVSIIFTCHYTVERREGSCTSVRATEDAVNDEKVEHANEDANLLPLYWDSKLWSRIPRHSEPRITVLTRASSNLTDRPKRQSQNHSYFTTVGLPPISSSWRQVPWDSRPEIFFFLQLNSCGQSLCDILSDERICLSLMNMLGLIKCMYCTYSIGLRGYGECFFFPGGS